MRPEAIQREIDDVAVAFGATPVGSDALGSLVGLKFGDNYVSLDTANPFWRLLVQLVRKSGPALLEEPRPGHHRAKARVFWTGSRWASAEDFAPRPGTPTAVLVADLPPPEEPEVAAAVVSGEGSR
jgi:hypothetical protein